MHMLENAGAAAFTFTDAEISELNGVVDAIEVQGARLADGVLAFRGRVAEVVSQWLTHVRWERRVRSALGQ